MPSYDGLRFSPAAPVATVSVAHPDLGVEAAGVAMLIDTGADVSVLPNSCVTQLALPEGTRTFEVLAYDNSIRQQRTVRAAVLFAGRRFTGEFIVLEQDVGVLGRDILNHFVVILDGPNATWGAR